VLNKVMVPVLLAGLLGKGPITAYAAEPASEAGTEAALLSNTRQLTFEGRRAGEGYFSADGGLMVFQSERDPANPFYQIYLMDLETGDVERVSPGHGKTTCAWIHPDRDKVLYASTHDDPESRSKMQAELDFRASGQQRRYSWDYDEHFDIYAQDLRSGERVKLTDAPGYDAEGAYSPDGSRIVFASNRRAYTDEISDAERAIFAHDKSFMMDIYVMDADGANVRRLTDAPGYDGGPFFSADGKYITWRRFSRDGSRAEIFTMDLATGEERQLTRMGVMSWAPYFHPSGDYLIFASNREGFANFELFLVDARGRREPVRVTYTDGFDGLPVFSPDGTWLAWTSNRTADRQSQIFRADWDDAEARRLLGLDADGNDVTVSAADVMAETGAAIRAADLRRHVERLTADDMAGRLTGTAGERRATGYVASAFDGLGLQPGGDDGTWYQAFPFTAGARLGDGNRLTVTGAATGEPEVDRDWRPLALSRDGTADAAGVVFAGYGLVAPGSDKIPDYDSYGTLDVAGKWVMLLRFLPESVPADWRRHFLHYSDLAYKAAVAKRRGALGILVVTGPAAESRDRLVELRLDAAGGTSSIAGIALSDELAGACWPRPAGTSRRCRRRWTRARWSRASRCPASSWPPRSMSCASRPRAATSSGAWWRRPIRTCRRW
jgi:Tol biopolymer transport system component